MSVTGYYNGNVHVPIVQTLTDTSETTIGDAAVNDTLTLASFAFCNDNGSAKVCQLKWYDGSTSHLIWQGSVSNDATAIVDNIPLRLVSGNEIRAVADSGVTVSLFYLIGFALGR